ncbi:DUF413 domain-containing protein [Gallaecimonas sp. GXIMD4217]|uniref:DUF413 domain-containing protein n=1 Tax=Gallaecimonas sp. GXIMD4217 TaxID=3131927 RepID=UPI00311AF2D2
MSNSFVSQKRFCDHKHYPRGFARSGDFTRTEAELLEMHGEALLALETGLREPATAEEHQFLAVCQGVRQPSSSLEKLWSKYRQVLGRKHKLFTASNDWVSSRSTVVYDDADDSDD